MNETQTPRRGVIDDPDGTVTQYSDFEPTEAAMQRLADLLFKEHWGDITVGPCIPGRGLRDPVQRSAQGLALRRLSDLWYSLRETFLGEPMPQDLSRPS